MNEEKPSTPTTFRRGFSLLELVMVIAIIAVVAAVAAPRFGRATARYHIDVAARRIVQDLSFASRQARNAGAERTVEFNAAGTMYTVSGVVGLERSDQAYFVDLTAEPYRCRVDSADFGGGRSVTFDAYGQADNGGQVVLKAGDFTRTVTLDANSGKASVQ